MGVTGHITLVDVIARVVVAARVEVRATVVVVKVVVVAAVVGAAVVAIDAQKQSGHPLASEIQTTEAPTLHQHTGVAPQILRVVAGVVSETVEGTIVVVATVVVSGRVGTAVVV